MEKKFHNLIIVDKSGSMSSIRKETIDGLNETIQSVRMTAERTPDAQHYLTIVFFCNCSIQYVVDHIKVEDAQLIRPEDYAPCCCTPLYDAIGQSCTKLEQLVGDDPYSTVSVTILTDGYENASKEFSRQNIVALIKRLKEEKGWLFSYIGTDHDVESVSFSLNIDNNMKFTRSKEGVKSAFNLERDAYNSWANDISEMIDSVQDFEDENELDECILSAKKGFAKGLFHKIRKP